MTDVRKARPSASAFWRYDNCRASFKLGLGQPDTPNKDSEDGVTVHALTAAMVDPKFHENPVIPADAEEHLVDKAISLAQQVDELEEKEFPGKAPARIVEERLWVDDEHGEPVYSGQPDIVSFDRETGKAMVIDYKSGWGEYEAADTNLQLRALAVLAFFNFAATQVVAVLARPGRAPTVALYATKEMLERATEQVFGLVDEITLNDHEPRAGDWCTFCPARAICPATHAAMNHIVPANQTITTIRDVPVQDFNDMMDRAQVAKKLVKALEEECKRRAVLAQPGLNWIIGEGDNMRSLPDPEKAYERVSSIFTPKEFLAACKPSISKIEASVKVKLSLTADKAKVTTNELLGDAIVTTKKAGSLTRIKTLPAK